MERTTARATTQYWEGRTRGRDGVVYMLSTYMPPHWSSSILSFWSFLMLHGWLSLLILALWCVWVVLLCEGRVCSLLLVEQCEPWLPLGTKEMGRRLHEKREKKTQTAMCME